MVGAILLEIVPTRVLQQARTHRCQLKLSWAVKTAAIQTKPACAGSKTFDFPLVRAGGLGFCSRDFQSPGLKLTPMGTEALPLRKIVMLMISEPSL